MYGLDILCGISKVSFEIPLKKYWTNIEKWAFHTQLKFKSL